MENNQTSAQGMVVVWSTISGVIAALLLSDWKPLVLGVLVGLFFGVIVGYLENRGK